jgi:hypothetical protein
MTSPIRMHFFGSLLLVQKKLKHNHWEKVYVVAYGSDGSEFYFFYPSLLVVPCNDLLL